MTEIVTETDRDCNLVTETVTTDCNRTEIVTEKETVTKTVTETKTL